MSRYLLILAIFFGCFVFLAKKLNQEPQKDMHTRTIVQTEKMVIHDTITQIEPRPVRIVCVKYDTVKMFTTQHDTIEATIPITQTTYNDSNYYAVISGYKATLDTIKVFNSTSFVTKKISTTHMKRQAFNVGFVGGIGYGFASKQIEPFIGMGVSVNLFK